MQQVINIGIVPSDGSGDPLRVSFDKINNNFTEVYSILANVSAPVSSIGQTGDILGMFAFDATYLYYCTASYDGFTNIWYRQTLTGVTW